jgi:hypothetical protein
MRKPLDICTEVFDEPTINLLAAHFLALDITLTLPCKGLIQGAEYASITIKLN